MIEKSQRPLINRPRYVFKPSNNVNIKNSNKPINKKNLNKQQEKRKVIDKQIQQPVSGSMNKIDEDIKVKPPVKSKPKPSQKKRTKKPYKPPRKPKAPKEEKKDSSVFKQMKDKFIGKSKDEGGN
tara:strand:+ start:36 stop:410 length:375 start_codon:yes stop_codon:yes gene_type:complete